MTMQKTDFTISAVKTFRTDDGGAYSGNLLYQGKKIGDFHNGGYGGPTDVNVVEQYRSSFDAFIKAQPPVVCDDMRDPHDKTKPFTYAVDAETLVGELMDIWFAADDKKKHEARLKRAAQKRTLFRLKGDEAGSWRQLNVLGDKAINYLKTKYADKVESIYGHTA